MGEKIFLTGQRFGRLTVLSEAVPMRPGRLMWNCQCDCGNTLAVMTNSLRAGTTKSCGCIRKERSLENFRKRSESRFVWVEHEGTRYVASDFLQTFGHRLVRPEIFRKRIKNGMDPVTAATMLTARALKKVA